MIKNSNVGFQGFAQATGVIVYLLLLSAFFNYLFPAIDESAAELLVPVIMLLVFIISAVTTASLVLLRAAALFWSKNYAKSFELLGWTMFWCVFYLLGTVLILNIA